MYKILKNIIEMDDYSIQRLSSRVSQYLWYKIWGNTRQGLLPSGYTQVDYIESTGTQYINTGFKPNDNTKIEIDWYTTSIKSAYVCGARATSNSTIIFAQSGSSTGAVVSAIVNGISVTASTGGTNWERTTNGQRYNTIIETKGNNKYNYNIKDLTNNREFNLSNWNYGSIAGNMASLYLFSFNPYNIIENMRLYSCKIYDNNILVRNFIPCYRNSDNKVGLYDIANNVFYSNNGTGSFYYGNVIPIIPTEEAPVPVLGVGDNITGLPINYTKVDYIESTGTQYIDTNFTPNSNTKYDINIEISSSVQQLRYFISAGSTYRNNIYCGGGTQQASAGYGSIYVNTNSLLQGNTKYNLILDKNLFYLDGVLVHTFAKETFDNTGNTILFARASDYATYSNIRLYDCKIYDNGVLIRDFIPCYRNSDNEVGLYDTVTKTFYTNQGTGSFIYGNVIDRGGYKIPIKCDDETKTIYLEEPLHKIGNYADILSYSDHNVTRYIKKIVFTGEEGWRLTSSSDKSYFILTAGILQKYKEDIILCTHYEYANISTNTSNVGIDMINSTTAGEDRFAIRDIYPETTTLNDFKTFLREQYANGTPVTAWVVLNEPEIEEIHAPEILADRYTSITVDTYIQPSQVDFTTKGKHVPQPSTRTVQSLNTANQLRYINSLKMMNEISEDEKGLETLDTEIQPIEKSNLLKNDVTIEKENIKESNDNLSEEKVQSEEK